MIFAGHQQLIRTYYKLEIISKKTVMDAFMQYIKLATREIHPPFAGVRSTVSGILHSI